MVHVNFHRIFRTEHLSSERKIRVGLLSYIGLLIGVVIAVLGFGLCWYDCWHNAPTYTASIPHFLVFLIGAIIFGICAIVSLGNREEKTIEVTIDASFSSISPIPKAPFFLSCLFFLFPFVFLSNKLG